MSFLVQFEGTATENQSAIQSNILPVDRGDGWIQFFGERTVLTVRCYADGSFYVHSSIRNMERSDEQRQRQG